jgi:hypothetical protein
MKRISLIFLLFTLVSAFSTTGHSLNEKDIAQGGSPLSQNQTLLKASDFAGKLDELLTLEMAAEISGFSASKVIKEHENNTHMVFGGEKKPPRECNYLWDNGRTRPVTVGGNTINAPYKDKVGINSVSNTTLERFKRNYGPLTEEQKQVAAKRLEEEAERNKSTPSDTKITQVGTGLIMNLQVEEITGVGEAATWYENSSELKVFYRGLIFSVVVDISDDKKVNREKSIELAKTIIQSKLIPNNN